MEVTQFKATLKKKMEAQASKRESINLTMQQITANNNSSARHRPGRRQMRDATVLDEEFVLERDWLPITQVTERHPMTHAFYIHNKYTHSSAKYKIAISAGNREQVSQFFEEKKEMMEATGRPSSSRSRRRGKGRDDDDENENQRTRKGHLRNASHTGDSDAGVDGHESQKIEQSETETLTNRLEDESTHLYSLYYIFDACWAEVWQLLETESFNRFDAVFV